VRREASAHEIACARVHVARREVIARERAAHSAMAAARALGAEPQCEPTTRVAETLAGHPDDAELADAKRIWAERVARYERLVAGGEWRPRRKRW
jgi:hypothetical protein